MQCRRPWLDSWVRKIHWRRDRLPTPVSLGFPCGSTGKESACNAGDLGLIPGLRRSPGEGKGYPLQYSGLENSMDCIVHGVAKSQTRLRDFRFSMPKSNFWDSDPRHIKIESNWIIDLEYKWWSCKVCQRKHQRKSLILGCAKISQGTKREIWRTKW